MNSSTPSSLSRVRMARFLSFADFWAGGFVILVISVVFRFLGELRFVAGGLHWVWAAYLYAFYYYTGVRNRLFSAAMSMMSICFVLEEENRHFSWISSTVPVFIVLVIILKLGDFGILGESHSSNAWAQHLRRQEERLICFADMWLPGLAIFAWWYSAQIGKISFPSAWIYVLAPTASMLLSFFWRAQLPRAITAGLASVPLSIWLLSELGGTKLVLGCLETFLAVTVALVALRILNGQTAR